VSSAREKIRDGETLALVAIGANLGDRLATMRAAVACVARIDGVRVVAQSGVYDTAPVGPPDQPRYLNAALALAASIGPRELLRGLLAVEAELGRERGTSRWTARTIDLDLILFGECTESECDIELPHPRFRERAFVLLPLAEIAGWARDPVTGERVESLLRACPGRSDAVLVGPLDPATRT
jgi:2-amino-4-hydroxy-6-hydroxymethyldihydropteridine diphosphokinase